MSSTGRQSSPKGLKILVCGDVEGKFTELFKRVETVNSKNGPFDLLLCPGSFFPKNFDEGLNLPSPPITTYILGPTASTQVPYYANMNGAELAPGIIFLGQSGVYNESSGLKLAYLSGVEAGNEEKDPNFQFDKNDVKNLSIRLEQEADFKGVDILMTSQWPADITNFSQKKLPAPVQSSHLISALCLKLKPRYMFSGLSEYDFEREPYRNHTVLEQPTEHVTRFIALGKVANAEKRKWLYAFQISPMKIMTKDILLQEPPNVTSNPFDKTILEKAWNPSNDSMPTACNSYFFDNSQFNTMKANASNRGHSHSDQNRKRHNHKQAMDGSVPNKKNRSDRPKASCWFCLASPEVQKHLVISIGDHSYLTLAKGCLVPEHVLILPIGHYQSTLDCPSEVIEEISQFKTSLKQYYETQNKGVVFYERNFKSPHLQIQVVPVPKSRCLELRNTLLDYAESEEIKLEEFPSEVHLFQITKPGYPYFVIEIPSGEKFFHGIKKYFPLQFGRQFLASPPILNVEERVDWRNCKDSETEETEWTKNFMQAFQKFDFTI